MTASLVKFLSRHGVAILFCLTIGCSVAAAFIPGQELEDRVTVSFLGPLAALMTLGIFRFFLGKLASHGTKIIGRLSLWYIVFVLYFAVVGVALEIFALPFLWQELNADGSAPMYVASLPCALAMAMAAADAIGKNYVEV
jgi:hypothetical protein